MHRRTCSLMLTLVFALLAIAPPVSSAAPLPATPRLAVSPAAHESFGHSYAYREYWCRIVTASDIRVFSTSTGSTVVGRLYKGDVFATTGIANNRYHLYNPYNDTWYGWATADPQWTDFVGYYCAG